MRLRRPLAATAAVTLATLALGGAPASAHDGAESAGRYLAAVQENGIATGGVTHVKNLAYPAKGAQTGTDIEFLKLGAKEYAIAGTTSNGMQIVDITTPTAPVLVATYPCPINQGDVQVFRQGSRVLATFTEDSGFTAAERAAAGVRCDVTLPLTNGTFKGTILVDLTDPLNPRGLSAVEISTGSHNMTVHPSGNFLYNSNSELVTDTTPTIEIVDISNPTTPKRLPDFAYPFNPSSLGANSHDVAFNSSGTRGYSASLSSTLILDTSNPAAPVLITQIENPRINLEHDVKWLPLRRPNGTVRELLLVGDELAGAAGNGSCPGGGITVFDITGALEKAPKDLGTWFINDTTGTTDTGNGAGAAGSTRCTAHVFAVYPEQGLLTIGWYQRGVRVLDISGLATFDTAVPVPAALGEGVGIKELGSYHFPDDSDTWSFKTNRIAANGSFFGYGNDISRGFDVYRFPGFTGGKTVAPLEPVDFAAGAEPQAVIPEVPVVPLLTVAGLGILGLAVARRRRAAAGPTA